LVADTLSRMSEPRIRKPTDRTCERCGREETWRDGNWRVAEDEDGLRVGAVHCVHEWDIDGSFVPFEGSAAEGSA
jgi:hypothetical protein